MQGTGPVRGTGTGGCAATVGRGVSSGRMCSDVVVVACADVDPLDGGRGAGHGGCRPGRGCRRRRRTGPGFCCRGPRGRRGRNCVGPLDTRLRGRRCGQRPSRDGTRPEGEVRPPLGRRLHRRRRGRGRRTHRRRAAPDRHGGQPHHRQHRRQRDPPPPPVHGGGKWPDRLPHSLSVSNRLLRVGPLARPAGAFGSAGTLPLCTWPASSPTGTGPTRATSCGDGRAPPRGESSSASSCSSRPRSRGSSRSGRSGCSGGRAPRTSLRQPRADVLRAWGRLGYPRRALRLHERRRRSRNGTVTSSRRRRRAGGAARRRLLHGQGGRGVRVRAALPGGRHERPPRRRASRARTGRRRAGPGTRRPGRCRRPAAPRRRRGRAGVGGADGAGRGRLHGPRAAVRDVPGAVGVRVGCGWAARVRRPAACRPGVRGHGPPGPRPAYGGVARFAGAGRAAALDAAWADAAQRDRCLASLLTDGLAEQLDDGRFALPA